MSMMKKFNHSKVTIELSYIQDDPNFDLFSFPYDFYEPQLKKQFENKFMDYYRYYEIGFETIERFQRQLMSKLNMIMPRYRQLYETELRAKKIDFMMNKDYKEISERTLTSDNESILKSFSNTNSSDISRGTNTTIGKESGLNNINAEINFDKLTRMASEEGQGEGTTESKSSDESTSNNNTKHFVTEKFETLGQGNIGVISASELLDKWRKTIINIDRMIIEECYDLFMLC